MNIIYIGKFRHTIMIDIIKPKFQNLNVAIIEGCSLKVALSEGGSSGNAES